MPTCQAGDMGLPLSSRAPWPLQESMSHVPQVILSRAIAEVQSRRRALGLREAGNVSCRRSMLPTIPAQCGPSAGLQLWLPQMEGTEPREAECPQPETGPCAAATGSSLVTLSLPSITPGDRGQTGGGLTQRGVRCILCRREGSLRQCRGACPCMTTTSLLRTCRSASVSLGGAQEIRAQPAPRPSSIYTQHTLCGVRAEGMEGLTELRDRAGATVPRGPGGGEGLQAHPRSLLQEGADRRAEGPPGLCREVPAKSPPPTLSWAGRIHVL